MRVVDFFSTIEELLMSGSHLIDTIAEGHAHPPHNNMHIATQSFTQQ
jgi:hypothetical protein